MFNPKSSEEEMEEKGADDMQEDLEEMSQDLRQQEQQRMPETGPVEYRRGIQENIKSAWEELLEPQFEGTELEEYSKSFKAALTNVVPIANIRRSDIPRYLTYFDEIWLWLKVKGLKIPPHIWGSFRMVFELNLTRSVEGFERRMQQQVLQPQNEEKEETGGLFDFLR